MDGEVGKLTPAAASPRRDRLPGGVGRSRRAPSAAGIARRRLLVGLLKVALPLLAVLLLTLIAAWPEISRIMRQEQLTLRALSAVEIGAGRMVEPHYHGIDVRMRPYTVTADIAVQRTQDRLDLTLPKADVTLANDGWLMVQSKNGVYWQHANQLDLSGDVVLYRQDGTTLTSQASAIDLKQGASTSALATHAEGPFGTLDATGYTLVDKGQVVQFHGPATLVLNQK